MFNHYIILLLTLNFVNKKSKILITHIVSKSIQNFNYHFLYTQNNIDKTFYGIFLNPNRFVDLTPPQYSLLSISLKRFGDF